mmetsp:Transcript_19679/g.44456  ORF Transcript_19679/g.44456 Transcript_19679/m.44456 type:complete len:226 (+) Transcript_19679:128-805(+)
MFPGLSPSCLPTSSSSPAASTAASSRSSSRSISRAISVSSLSFVPSSRVRAAPPRSSAMARLSALYIRTALARVLWAVKVSSATRLTTSTASGRSLFRNAPMSAPAMVSGSMTRMRSQSTSGRSARGCRFRTLSSVLATAPPKTVMFDRGMACLGEKPITRMKMGTRTPPPPMPPPAATMRPSVAKKKPYLSDASSGSSPLCLPARSIRLRNAAREGPPCSSSRP